MKKLKSIWFIMMFMISIGLLCSCKTTEDKKIQSMDLSKLIECKDSYVGDNSKVTNIVKNLPAAEYNNGIELQTEKEPYEVNVNYKDFKEVEYKFENSKTISKDYSEVMKKNAFVMFSLIKNVDIINFKMDNQEYSFKRNECEINLGNEKSLKEFFSDEN